MPRIGFGVWQIPKNSTASCVAHALDAGYRHIDTAAVYRNEAEVGEGLRASRVARGEIFVTTKVSNDDHGFDRTLAAFEKSIGRIGLDYLDLYLIHWPCPARGLQVETWRALVRLQAEGRVRSIGVSNFEPQHIRDIIDATGIVPAVNQIELHPRFQQRRLRATNEKLGIVTESWSPLGQGALLDDKTVRSQAEKYRRQPAQIVLRWHLQSGLAIIPRSASPRHIVANLDIEDFALDPEDVAALDALDRRNGRIGPDPLVF